MALSPFTTAESAFIDQCIIFALRRNSSIRVDPELVILWSICPDKARCLAANNDMQDLVARCIKHHRHANYSVAGLEESILNKLSCLSKQ
jgi:hypothetical protein